MAAAYLVDLAAQSLANRRRSRTSDSSRGGWVLAALTVAGALATRRLIEGKTR